MADDGSVVFFSSPVALVPGALNEVVADEAGIKKEGLSVKFAQNIYEWEAQGQGSCVEAGGCIWLISDGKDTAESGNTLESVVELLGSDTTGQNVFFATTSRLVPADTDTQRDYYDARVGGGFPVAVPPPACEGDVCHPVTSGTPIFGPVGSFAFSGPGNSPPPASAPSVQPKKALTRAQLLARALKTCRARHGKSKRVSCEAQARKRYSSKHSKGRK